MSNRKLVSFRLPDDLMQELRERADRDSISVTELVCRMLRQGLHPGEGELEADVDDRITSLEAEVQELKQVKRLSNPGSSTPLSALLHRNAPHLYDPDFSLQARLQQLEQMALLNQSAASYETTFEVKAVKDRVQQLEQQLKQQLEQMQAMQEKILQVAPPVDDLDNSDSG